MRKSFLASNIKYLRLKNGMTQSDLAHLLGRQGTSTISEWEKGKYGPKKETLHLLTVIFKISLDDLLYRDLTTYPLSSQQESAEEISYISENLPPTLKEQWIAMGTELLNKKDI
ncbi:DNA-binding protein [Streptococcus penaeicida]|uniref:DNA-binding protein n=1 Tax=Streptococcus penaeicida TaxID=1765960 RepID=A0A2N8LEE9_9STRE|nr:helix-turn-helix transcriptional regulator [Streptococcus penaeicida]PND48530.1 DNA-binding protein [Streptococcus penaeicida]